MRLLESIDQLIRQGVTESGDQDHQYGHRPSKGVQLHKLGDGSLVPEDIMYNPSMYTGFDRYLDEYWPQVKEAAGNPDYEIPIYRAIPKEIDFVIHKGDWVTLSRGYARYHMENSSDDMLVISTLALAQDLYWAGDDLTEWGYWGKELIGDPIDPRRLP